MDYTRIPATPRNELLANLWVFRKHYAAVPHGKIYGVLGLIKETDVSLVPDYEQSFLELYYTVVLEDIKLSGNLHAFMGTYGDEKPSWCIDWSAKNSSNHDDDRSRALTMIYAAVYSASASHHARVEVLPPRNHARPIRVTGHIFDKVQSCRDVRYMSSSGTLFEWLEKLQVSPGGLITDSSYITGESAFSAF